MSQNQPATFYRNDRYTNMNSPGIRINKLASEGFLKPTFAPATPGPMLSPYQNLPPQNGPAPAQTFFPQQANAQSNGLPQDMSRFRDVGSPGKPDLNQQRLNPTHSIPRRIQTNHNQQESTDGRHITSTDSRNPLLVSYGETSRDHTFSRSGMNGRAFEIGSESKLYSSPMQSSYARAQNDSAPTSSTNFQTLSQADTNQRVAPYGLSNASRVANNGSRGLGSAFNREELELLRSKNKAFVTVTKDMFPGFLDKIEKMSQTVHKNINHSFTSKLKDIWISYLNDQNDKNPASGYSGKTMNSYLQDLKPIEMASVEALNAQTENLIKKIKLEQIEEINKKLSTPSNEEPDIDRNHPLYQLEIDFRFFRDKRDQISSQYQAHVAEENRTLYEMRKKSHHTMQLYYESLKREHRVKIGNDPKSAENILREAREFYLNEIARMRADLRGGPQKVVQTYEQGTRIAELENKIAHLKNKVKPY